MKQMADDLFEAPAPRGPHPGRSHSQPNGETRSAGIPKPSRAQTPIITVNISTRQEYLAIMPRSGGDPLRHVTEPQARSLLALALVDPICRSRRGVIVGLRVSLGVSIAAINAALRLGQGNRLPVAEDNRTVRRVSVAGGGVYHEPIHVNEWDDGRPLDNRCIEPGQRAQLGARVKSKIDRDGDE